MNNPTPSDREDVEMLLPWYVTGKLGAEDKLRVERMLATDADLARQLALIRDEQSANIATNESVPAPRGLTVERGMAAVASATTIGVRKSSAGVIERLRDFFTMPSPRAVRYATAAGLAALLLQTAVIGSLLQQREGYQTASGGEVSGSTVIVKFADGASAVQIASTLGQMNISIVDGPKPGGTFVVRVGPKSLSKADRDTQIAALRKASGVIALVLP